MLHLTRRLQVCHILQIVVQEFADLGNSFGSLGENARILDKQKDAEIGMLHISSIICHEAFNSAM